WLETSGVESVAASWLMDAPRDLHTLATVVPSSGRLYEVISPGDERMMSVDPTRIFGYPSWRLRTRSPFEDEYARIRHSKPWSTLLSKSICSRTTPMS